MKLVPIVCNTMRLDGGAMFGHVPKSLWEKWVSVDPHNCTQLACRSLFLQTDDGRNVLFDVGVGNFFDPKLHERYGIENVGLDSALEKMGIHEKDIDIVILSHLHFDHAGGLLSRDEKNSLHLRFPKAKYYLSRSHWERAQAPHIRERTSFIPELAPLLSDSKRLMLIDESTTPELDFGVSFSFSNGHTMGMMLSQLSLPSGLVVFASDLIPGLPWIHLPVTTGYDRYPELVVKEKEELLNTLFREKGNLVLTHDLHTAFTRVTKDAQGRWKALSQPIFREL